MILDLLFPPLCLSCQHPTSHLFCSACARDFELLDPQERCPYCFLENERGKICRECRERKNWEVPTAAALEYGGGVTALVKGLKYGKLFYLAKTAAAFMALQFERLRWPIPDLLIPVPRPWTRTLTFGIHHTEHLAKELGKLLQIPTCFPLKQKSGHLSQTRLSASQREHYRPHYTLKRKHPLEDKRLLLIDDVMTTGTTLHACQEALFAGYPRKIYALTLCRSIKS